MVQLNRQSLKDKQLRYVFFTNEALKLALSLLQNCGFYKQPVQKSVFVYTSQNKFKSFCCLSGKSLKSFPGKYKLTRFKFRSLVGSKVFFGFRASM